MLPLQRAWVQSQVGELRSLKRYAAWQKNSMKFPSRKPLTDCLLCRHHLSIHPGLAGALRGKAVSEWIIPNRSQRVISPLRQDAGDSSWDRGI